MQPGPAASGGVRVGYLTSQYPGTTHTFIRREVSALRALGCDLHTFSVRVPPVEELRSDEDRAEWATTTSVLGQPLSAFARAHVAELVRAPFRYLGNLGFALRHRAPGARNALLAVAHFGEAVLLARQLRKSGVTHLHNHFANSAATVGLIAARQAGIGWSFTIHGISEFDYPAGLTLAAKIAAAKFVACVSYFGRAQAERMTDPSVWPKLRVVRCGLELDRLPAVAARRPDEVVIVAVGRLSAEKGFAGLIEAFSQLSSEQPARLRLVGDGPLLADLQAQVDRLGIAGRVDFLGRLSEAETLQAIAASDLLVLSSFMEGLPIVLMEALALRKPVIASRVAGIPELVRDGETGRLFTPSNWDELATVLQDLVLDREGRSAMGARGPAVIARDFDVRASATILRGLFRESAPSGSTPPERLSG